MYRVCSTCTATFKSTILSTKGCFRWIRCGVMLWQSLNMYGVLFNKKQRLVKTWNTCWLIVFPVLKVASLSWLQLIKKCLKYQENLTLIFWRLILSKTYMDISLMQTYNVCRQSHNVFVNLAERICARYNITPTSAKRKLLFGSSTYIYLINFM